MGDISGNKSSTKGYRYRGAGSKKGGGGKGVGLVHD